MADIEELAARIGRLAELLGSTAEIQMVMTAARQGDVARAESLTVDLEEKLVRIGRERGLEQRIASLVASDEEVADLQKCLILDGPDVAEPRVQAAEERESRLRMKAALGTPVGIGRFLGDWVTGRLYEPGDVVRWEDGLYLCVAPTKTPPPGKAWEVLVAKPPVQFMLGIAGGGTTVVPDTGHGPRWVQGEADSTYRWVQGS